MVAQRLIRTLCPDCKEPIQESPEVLEAYGFTDIPEDTVFYNATRDSSCMTCGGTGFDGRRAICEALPFTADIRKHIVTAGDTVAEQEIQATAVEGGMVTLQGAARAAVLRGETSLEEMLRVVFTGME